jgi:hypothetical protein
MPKYIEFVAQDPGSRHPRYLIRNIRGGDVIGNFDWYQPWGRYIAEFTENSVWSRDCLEDVVAFMKQLGG